MVDALHREGLGEGRGDPLGDRHRLGVVGEAVDQDPELVAAEAGDDVAGAQVRAQPRRDGAQQGVAGVVAEAVVDQLEVVEVEEEDPDRRAGDRGAAERVVDRVDEAEPVGQAGERVVEDAVAQRAVGGVALEGVGEDVGGGFEEGHVLGAEAARLARVDVEHAEGPVLAVDHHRQRGGGAEGADGGRHREAIVARPVGDDHRDAGVERRARVRFAPGGDAAAFAAAAVLQPGAEVEPTAVAPDLPYTRGLDPVEFADQGHRVVHQRLGVAVFQRPPAEPGDHRLLVERPLQVDLDRLALGDVVEDAVPDRDAGAVGLEHRLVEHPDQPAALRIHAVLDRRGFAVAERVAAFHRQRVEAVVGMDLAGPEARVAEELLRGEAEDLLDLGADVAPAPGLTELGGVDDDRQPVDQPTALVVASPAEAVEEGAESFVLGPVWILG